MSRKNNISTAEMSDRHRQYLALAFLAVSFIYLARALTQLVSEDVAAFLDMAILGLAILTVLLILPAFYWKLRRLPSGERHLYFSEDSYVADVLKKAKNISWAATFLTLIGFEVIARRLSTELSSAFYLQLILAVMLGVVSSVFLFLNWRSNAQELEGDFDA